MNTTQTTHTPGPWKIQHEFDDEPSYLIGPENSDICMFEPPYQERQADIRLIAAAPMMYGQLGTSIDALREALRQAAAADYDQVHALLSGVIAGHELAIAQAEGRP